MTRTNTMTQGGENGMAAEVLAAPRLLGYRVLAAEDNAVNQFILIDFLGMEGALIECAADGIEAVEILEKTGPAAWDLVLTDIQMPKMDGYQLADHLREHYPELPVVGLTAHAGNEELQRCLAHGMVDQLAKPVTAECLVSAVLQHAHKPPPEVSPAAVANTQMASSVTALMSPAAEPGHDAEIVDWARLERNFPGRDEFIDHLIDTTIKSNVNTAKELREAIERSDFTRVAFIAHTLRSVAGNVEARRTSELARLTEQAASARAADCFSLAARLADACDALLNVLWLR